MVAGAHEEEEVGGGVVTVVATEESRAGEKKEKTRARRNESTTPASNKKQKLSAASPIIPSPASGTPVPAEKKAATAASARLPARLWDSRPLPTLPDAQPVVLSADDYQSIAASAVLETSLERSRRMWMQDGVFDKYWVKPEKEKAGRTPKALPPGNPDHKWAKARGECRIRIEPHMFTINMFTEERPKPASAKQNGHHKPHQPLQQPYGHIQNHHFQPQPLPPQHHQANSSIAQRQPLPPPRAQASQSPSQQADKKAGPDPVISMLATRASSDPTLKALMKEVATGNATPDQLKVFQKHIDELTGIIQKQKAEEAFNNPPHGEKTDAGLQTTPQVAPHAQTQQHLVAPHSRPPPYPASQHPSPATFSQQQPRAESSVPPTHPVILEFKDPDATEDRFLFPQYSILENLSPQHLLVSFILTRMGQTAADVTGLELDKEYWQPITMMVEVAYGREELLNCVRRWVKPAEDVRKHMEDIMKRCVRVPDSHLALRLPFKGATVIESETASKEATPMVDEKPKPKSSVKYVKRATPSSVPIAPIDAASKQNGANSTPAASTPPPVVAAAMNANKDVGLATTSDGGIDKAGATDSGRPRRTVRKSVRISEG